MSTSATAAQWWPVASVFVSALLAMIVGILLDAYKHHREQKKTAQEKREREVRQINTVIAGIGFNVEALLHIVMQNILPHHTQSHLAYRALHQTQSDDQRVAFARSLHVYPALMLTCPQGHFIEGDFWKELPFIIEKDPELLKQSGWLVSYARELNNATAQRNKNIEVAQNVVLHQGGAINFHALSSILQMQASISNTEVLIALQFFQLLRGMATNLEAINASYKVKGKRSKLIPPPALEAAIKELQAIADEIAPQMQHR